MKKILLTAFILLNFTNLIADDEIEIVVDEEYVCDGREYCSQMTSCEEAIFFINNCPNTKMDGDGDGVPCEKQWCGSKKNDR